MHAQRSPSRGARPLPAQGDEARVPFSKKGGCALQTQIRDFAIWNSFGFLFGCLLPSRGLRSGSPRLPESGGRLLSAINPGALPANEAPHFKL